MKWISLLIETGRKGEVVVEEQDRFVRWTSEAFWAVPVDRSESLCGRDRLGLRGCRVHRCSVGRMVY